MRYWTTKPEDGGYEKVNGTRQTDSGEWINTDHVAIHRLASVAWFGFDAVVDRDVHHRISIPWLNVESNLVPLPPEEHAIITGYVMKNGHRDSVVSSVTEAFGDG